MTDTARRPLTGADYRVKARHPRRDTPLVIADAAGHVLGTSGETCEACSPEALASMLRNGYIERIAPGVDGAVPAKPKRRTTERT